MSALIYGKMSAVMKEIKSVGKDQKNQAQGYKFRGIDDMINALYPALTKHGVFMTPRCTTFTQDLKDVTRSNGKAGVDKHVAIQVEYDFYAEDGSKVTVGPIPAEGLDSGDKATNKALSAALKYALIQTFSVPTQDMAEADLESPEIGVTAGKDVKVPSVEVQATASVPPAKVIRKPAGFARKSDVDVHLIGAHTTATTTVTQPTISKVATSTTADGWES